MAANTRFIEIPGENQHQMIVGFVLKDLAHQCQFNAEELANKARVGSTYVRRIFNGLAPLMQEFQIQRLCAAMDIPMSEFYTRVENTSFSHVRARLQIDGMIAAAGGCRLRLVSPPKKKKKTKTKTPAKTTPKKGDA